MAEENGGDWKGHAPRWFLLVIIAILTAGVGIPFFLWWPTELVFRNDIYNGLSQINVNSGRITVLESEVRLNQQWRERMSAQLYEGHRDVLRFYLFYAETQGDGKQVKFFSERLKEWEASKAQP